MIRFYSIPVEHINVEEINNGDFLKIDMYAISDGENNNGSEFLKESFEPSILTVYNKPILAYYNKDIQDTEEHNSKMQLDDKGNIWYDYQYEKGERPVGTIPESADVCVKQKDGKSWLYIGNALIWTEYNRQLIELIKKQLRKKVSVEIDVLDSEEINGVERIKLFKFLGVTILGKEPDGTVIESGIEDAHLRVKELADSMLFKKYNNSLKFALNKKTEENILKKYGIKKEKTDGRVSMSLTHRELENRLWADLSKYNYERDGYTNHKYWVEDVEEDKSCVIVRDNETSELFIIPYHEDDGEVHVDLSEKKPATMEYKSYSDRDIEVYISNKEYGTENAITIDKSKDSVSHDSWGKINKTDLRNKVLKAKNYKTLVKSVYLYVGPDWEKHKGELKYPVMQIKDSKLVYNANGLLSAQQYGEKYDESVAKKALSIRKRLGLVEMDKKKKFIKSAREQRLVFIGEANGKLIFIEDDDEKETMKIEDSKVVEVCEKDIDSFAKNEEDFAWDEITEKDVCMSEVMKFDDDDEDDDDDDKDKKKEVESLKAENKELKMKCENIEKEIRMKEEEKFKEDTDAILSDEDEDIDEETKEDLKKMRDEKKFSCVEDFVKEIAYRKYISKNSSKTNKLDFKVNTKNKENSTKSKSAIDILDRI